MKSVQKSLYILINGIIVLCFSKLMIDILTEFYVAQSGMKIVLRTLFLVLAIALFAGIYYLLKKCQNFLKRYDFIILGVFLLLLFILQLFLGNSLRVTPMYDYSSVYDGAVSWIVEGSFPQFYDYYYYYPNNLGELSLLAGLFLFGSKLGIQDFYLLGMILNSLLSLGLIASTFLLLRRLFSSVEAVMSLVFYAFCPPIYLMAAVFYSDQLTMLFPVLILLFYSFYSEQTFSIKKSEPLAILITLACYAGYFIKPTVFIAMIAICILLLLKGEFKKLLLLIANTALVFFICTALFQGYIYSHHLDKEVASQMQTPTETWIYMGLNENPGFSPEDTEFSRSIADPAARKNALREGIAERINQYGFIGLMSHIRRKGITVFSDGTFELSYTFLFGFQKEPALAKYVTTLGSHYEAYWELCAYFWYAILLFGIVSEFLTAYTYFKGSYDSSLAKLLPAGLSLLGLYLFLMMWEIHCRYAVNYYGCFILLAVGGLYGIDLIREKKNGPKQTITEKNERLSGS